MPIFCSGLGLVLVVFWCCTCILAVEHRPKSVVFSYASASHPHVATLSHHYRAPPSSEPQFQNYLPPSGQHSHQYIPPPAFQNNHFPNTVAHSIPPPLQPSTSQSFHPENVHQQGGHMHGDGVIHYHDRSLDAVHHPSVGSPTPVYDQTTVRPFGYESSTVVYNNHQPVDNHTNYYDRHVFAADHDYDLHRFDDQSTMPPDLGYSPTPIYYNDGPTNNSPNIQPSSYDLPQGYEHSSTGVTYPLIHHGGLTDDLHHSQNSRPNSEQQFHDYSTPQPIYYDSNYKNDNYNNNIPIDYDSPQNISMVKSPQFGSNLTNPPNSNQNAKNHFDGSLNQNFPDYQTPDSPEYFYQHSSHPPRGDKTFSPLPPSPTPIYYEEENEYISTTPIVEFESAKQNLPPIKDYPPPKPDYITKSSKNPFNMKKKIEREQRTRRPSKVLEKSAYINDKVLQKPKYFAYSSDVFDDHDGAGGEIEQDGNQSIENNEEHDHEQKKKDEKYAKGGGQEHHSSHKTAAGDKGNKGYKSGHEHEEDKKGHHEKEDHKRKYVDEKGKKGKKEEEGGHYGEQHKAEKGKKAAKYGQSGEHKKGHSTKGEHNIHKMDEYMKKHEFFDEHHEGGDHEKFGGFMEAHAHKKGGKKKKGHHKGGHHQKKKGKKGHHEKGHKLGHHKGHKDAKGYDGHFSKHKKYGKKGGSKKGKKWGYSKGHPPK